MTFDGVTPGLAVAFANTACGESSCCSAGLTFDSVAQLIVDSGAIQPPDAQRLSREPSSAREAALREIESFRDVVRDMIAAFASQRPPRDADLRALHTVLASLAYDRSIVADDAGRYRDIARLRFTQPRDLLMPIAQSLAELLASEDPQRVKRCREPRCSCFFIDTSKNQTRAWCSMQRCGNRRKVANYYRRSRENETAEA